MTVRSEAVIDAEFLVVMPAPLSVSIRLPCLRSMLPPVRLSPAPASVTRICAVPPSAMVMAEEVETMPSPALVMRVVPARFAVEPVPSRIPAPVPPWRVVMAILAVVRLVVALVLMPVPVARIEVPEGKTTLAFAAEFTPLPVASIWIGVSRISLPVFVALPRMLIPWPFTVFTETGPFKVNTASALRLMP
ncbi:hypothetical protein D9M71_635880 [compost metagenome]